MKRLQNLRREKLKTNLKVKSLMFKITAYNVHLEELQSDELCEFLTHVKEEDLNTICNEITAASNENIAVSLRTAFEDDQLRNSEYFTSDLIEI